MSLGTQTYRGFNKSGVSGALVGLGRGALGTVSKPIVGALDFAAGIAGAIRETSRVSSGGMMTSTSSGDELPRVRETRCCSSIASLSNAAASGGSSRLLTSFSRADAYAQSILYQVNGFDLTEKYIAIENLKSSLDSKSNSTERIFVSLSSEFTLMKTKSLIYLIFYSRVLFRINV